EAPPETVREGVDVAETLHLSPHLRVRVAQALPDDVHHAEDDVEVVLHHHGERIAADAEQDRVLVHLGGSAARRTVQERELPEEVPRTEKIDLLRAPVLGEGEPHAPFRDDEHLVAGLTLPEQHGPLRCTELRRQCAAGAHATCFRRSATLRPPKSSTKTVSATKSCMTSTVGLPFSVSARTPSRKYVIGRPHATGWSHTGIAWIGNTKPVIRIETMKNATLMKWAWICRSEMAAMSEPRASSANTNQTASSTIATIEPRNGIAKMSRA